MNAFLNKIYTLDLVSIHLSYTLKKGLTVPLIFTYQSSGLGLSTMEGEPKQSNTRHHLTKLMEIKEFNNLKMSLR